MSFCAAYPTVEHRRAAEAIVAAFSQHPDVEAVMLFGSCARGKARWDSCLDVMILVLPDVLAARRGELERWWNDLYQAEPAFLALRRLAKFSHVDLDFVDGRFAPGPHGWTTGPDEFELEIGNTLVYSAPLWERGDYVRRLKAQWLPYYGEELRHERLAMVRRFCLNNLDHIPPFVERGLYFQAFNRLYDAFREFLQALFIARRTYPIAYDKWIREQIEEILGLSQLYRQLPGLLEIPHFESLEIADKAADLLRLVEEYI
jgi:predicted nucleotidyltransferase